MIFISNNIQAMHQVSDSIAVIYRGKIVECGAAYKVFLAPENDYTKTLLAAAPALL